MERQRTGEWSASLLMTLSDPAMSTADNPIDQPGQREGHRRGGDRQSAGLQAGSGRGRQGLAGLDRSAGAAARRNRTTDWERIAREKVRHRATDIARDGQDTVRGRG